MKIDSRSLSMVGAGAIAVGAMIAAFYIMSPAASVAIAAESKIEWLPDASPTKPRPQAEREAYFPGTEELGKDEMRIFVRGTGMPTARPKQAATCFLVELGNGDKFVFDLGTGSTERLSALRIPWDYLNKALISHLHTDHFYDFDTQPEVERLVGKI